MLNACKHSCQDKTSPLLETMFIHSLTRKDQRSRSRLGKFALCFGSRAALHRPLRTSDLLLAFGDVVQSLTVDGLTSVALSSCSGTTSYWSRRASDVFLCFGDVVNGLRIERAGPRCLGLVAA